MMTNLPTNINVQAIWYHRAAALLFTGVATYYLLEARTYPYMDSTGPGAGFFPMWVGGLAVLIGIGLLITAKSAAATAPVETVKPGSRRTVIVTLISLSAAAGLLEILGFRITAFLLILALLKAYGSSLRTALIISFVASLSVSFLFQALHVQLPVGNFGF